jgi:hypothetical protein
MIAIEMTAEEELVMECCDAHTASGSGTAMPPGPPNVRFSSDSRRSAALRRIGGLGQKQT